jgi:hypothetical protein
MLPRVGRDELTSSAGPSAVRWLCRDYHSLPMRYYEQKYPEIDELVMVQVRQIAEMGAYVKLVSRDKPAEPLYPDTALARI